MPLVLANMKWQEVKVEVNTAAGEAVSNILQELGADGVIIDEKGQRIEITAYYPAAETFILLYEDLQQEINRINSFDPFTGSVKINLTLRKDEDWKNSWHKFFKPLQVGERFLICPEWEDCSESDRIIISINPGTAFGIGGHITTQMAIRFLERYINPEMENMLDIGVGTGILSICSAKMGLKEILSIDIDRSALDAARRNILINGVQDSIILSESNLFSEVAGCFSLITANMLPQILTKLFPEISAYIRDGGILILAGITDRFYGEIVSSLEENNFQILEHKSDGEWTGLAARKG